jgi:hypothetical protein
MVDGAGGRLFSKGFCPGMAYGSPDADRHHHGPLGGDEQTSLEEELSGSGLGRVSIAPVTAH